MITRFRRAGRRIWYHCAGKSCRFLAVVYRASMFRRLMTEWQYRFGILATVSVMVVTVPSGAEAHSPDAAMPLKCDVEMCKYECKLVWEYDERQCNKIDPEKRKERERCHRRANEAYAKCIVDCEQGKRC